MNIWFLFIPFLSAFIGWLFNQIAGKILVSKLIPARQTEMASELSQKIASEFSLDELKNKISDPANVTKVMPVVEAHIDGFLRHKLKEKMPMIGMLIGEKTINSLKEVFMKEIEEMFPQVMDKFVGHLETDLDLQSLIFSKIKTIPPKNIETRFKPVLQYFGLVGALAGFLIGLVDFAMHFFLNF